jgi:hypothetical protein
MVVKKTRKKISIGKSYSETKKYLTDILILHGKDQELVDDLIKYFESLGISANTVLKLKSNGLSQPERVKHAIKNSRFRLVLMTFDPDNPKATGARPNVYDELRLSELKGSRNLLILREQRDSKLVEFPSNLMGKCVSIEFNRIALHRLFIELNKEISFLINSSNPVNDKFQSGTILNKFLDEMDDLWEEHFDDAYNEIRDGESEKDFSDALDDFFIAYHSVFEALIRKKTTKEQLRQVIQNALSRAKLHTFQVWYAVAEGYLKALDKKISEKSTDKKFDISLLHTKRDEGNRILRQAKRKNVSFEEKVTECKNAINILKDAYYNL